ncbi:bifunctional phosphopantothenoylcysteine decarboxylase/phosphopantothenate--cysteine ligase CoaBC [Magnetovibrio blakemorei]|uniref:Coenzyme A biosynthesis bifunctional protein CoaBC n=1 Tax=Magnetovibrio blakemorei TaxID=28181 RepID=A0A1E5Q3C5_9PROT|nr:bifunctional phosphopantothenoylcysteine decarboxylase/phosphopantothenate--cysteine ligase CoaBC [Magnetovibrio blakemorei]OEJ63745.1 bifunctional phosphopantothenoylcysteine decarboxylase/phosphopantothenate synthase [Magnetovibrio blakemorei]
MLNGKRILLIVTGGIAAYKTPELVRQLIKAGATVRCVLTRGGAQFVTPLALASVSGDQVYSDLFSLTDEHEMGHINLSREADVVLVAPATANTLAKMAHGLADNLSTTVLLATDKPVLAVPAMNVRMWEHAATKSNIAMLRARGVTMIGPDEGEMACGEWGEGRMAEPEDIVLALSSFFGSTAPLGGYSAIVTSGPTHEPIDPVRYIANRSSGKQGHAIAQALKELGARVTLISGPVDLPDPQGVKVIHVQSARDMATAVEGALPADIAVCAAAVADWRVDNQAPQKLKKGIDGMPSLSMVENPDILAALSRPGERRPQLVVGFAAETENVLEHARAKLAKKGCDWICANDVSPSTGTFGGDQNTVQLVTRTSVEDWPSQSKFHVAKQLATRIAAHLGAQKFAHKPGEAS